MEYQQSGSKFSFDTDAFNYTNEENEEQLVFTNIVNNVDSSQDHVDKNTCQIQEEDKNEGQLEFQQDTLNFQNGTLENDSQQQDLTKPNEGNQFEREKRKNPEQLQQQGMTLPGEYATSVYTQESFTTSSEHVGEGSSQEASFPEGSKTSEVAEESERNNSSETQNHKEPKSERELLAQKAQDIINDVNSKRKKDTKLLEDFRAAVLQNNQETCTMVENFIVEKYGEQSATIQEKLNELFAILDRVALLEEELAQFKHALGLFYQDTIQGNN